MEWAIIATIILAAIIYFIGLSMIYAIGVFILLLIIKKTQQDIGKNKGTVEKPEL